MLSKTGSCFALAGGSELSGSTQGNAPDEGWSSSRVPGRLCRQTSSRIRRRSSSMASRVRQNWRRHDCGKRLPPSQKRLQREQQSPYRKETGRGVLRDRVSSRDISKHPNPSPKRQLARREARAGRSIMMNPVASWLNFFPFHCVHTLVTYALNPLHASTIPARS